jgi:hypothetical protein
MGTDCKVYDTNNSGCGVTLADEQQLRFKLEWPWWPLVFILSINIDGTNGSDQVRDRAKCNLH